MSGNPKIWAKSDDGNIHYQLLTQEYLELALNVMKEAFFAHENICVAVGLNTDPEAIKELEELTLRAARDGCTVIAVDKTNNRVAGAAFNKLQVKNAPEDNSYFETFAKNCKHSRSRAVVEYMIQADALVDIFDICKVDSLLEIMFLATLSDYRGKGIGRVLCEVSIEVAKKLIEGVNVKQAIDNGPQPSLEPIPKVVSAIFTSFITQKIGRQLDFEIAAEQGYDGLFFQGVSYASVVGAHTNKATIEYKKLV